MSVGPRRANRVATLRSPTVDTPAADGLPDLLTCDFYANLKILPTHNS